MKTAAALFLRCALGLTAIALASSASATAVDDVDTVIARARAFLGADAALDAVHSLHFLGVVTADDNKTHKIEIIMRRPMHELMIETSESVRVLTGLDDYVMWRRIDPIDRPGTGRVQLMNAQGVRYTRANVGQTLFYYRNLESIGGTAVVEGEEDVEGIRCVRTVFTHPGDVRYIRFFDLATGRLVVTRSESGSETRESGEMIVAGIRFPTELMTTVEGKTSRITFEEIRVNAEFDFAMFAMPKPTFDFERAPDSAIAAAPNPVAPPEKTAALPVEYEATAPVPAPLPVAVPAPEPPASPTPESP